MRRRLRDGAIRAWSAVVAVIPAPLRLTVGLAVLVALAFGVILLPFFQGGSAPQASVSGTVPATATAGHVVAIDVGIDNSGGVDLNHLCLAITILGDAHAQDAVIQGLDRIPFRKGIACGGFLTGGETVSAVVDVLPAAAGPLSVTIGVVDAAGRSIGPTLQGTTEVMTG